MGDIPIQEIKENDKNTSQCKGRQGKKKRKRNTDQIGQRESK